MGFDGAAFDATDEELARAALAGARAPLDTVDFERLREVGWAEADLPEDFRPFAQGGFGTPSGRFRLWSRATCRPASTRRPATPSRWRS